MDEFRLNKLEKVALYHHLITDITLIPIGLYSFITGNPLPLLYAFYEKIPIDGIGIVYCSRNEIKKFFKTIPYRVKKLRARAGI